MTQRYEVIFYKQDGKDFITDWINSLRDNRGKLAVMRSIARVEEGNFGEHRFCRDGVWELVINTGPGYRVYYSLIGNTVVLLLCGGDKGSQPKDINKAIEFLKHYKEN